jgi:hypothetical protein
VKHLVTRREMLKATAAATLAVPALSQPKSKAKAHLFFTPQEFAMVDELTEIIIPTDEHSPGARAAKVAAYIDQTLAEAFEDESREEWRTGLKSVNALSLKMHGKLFLKASAEQREAVVAKIAQSEQNPKLPEEEFFVELKQRTARGYYTSKIGIHQEMEYKGNTYLKEYVGEEVK